MIARAPRLLLLLTVVAAACSSLDDGDELPPPELRVAKLGDLASVAVCGDVWLAGTPQAEHLDLAHRRGIRTVISLLAEDARGELEIAGVCRDLGIAFVPADVGPEPTNDDIDRVLAALERPGRGPTLMYCESGARCAMVFAIYRVVEQGVPLEEALEAARRTGMKPGASEDIVREQVARYGTRFISTGIRN